MRRLTWAASFLGIVTAVAAAATVANLGLSSDLLAAGTAVIGVLVAIVIQFRVFSERERRRKAEEFAAHQDMVFRLQAELQAVQVELDQLRNSVASGQIGTAEERRPEGEFREEAEEASTENEVPAEQDASTRHQELEKSLQRIAEDLRRSRRDMER
jgi:Flp pilus assembly protein TadB